MTKEQQKIIIGSIVLSCDCNNEFQDKEYGKNKRLHTLGLKGKVCTVCGKIKTK